MLSKDDYDRVERLVEELLDLNEADRASRLAAIAGESPQLMTRIQAQLAADARLTGTDFMAYAASASHEQDVGGATNPSVKPDQIGAYEILRHLGAGGMGTVYLARQKEPVERLVALKVTHAFETDRERSRFALEAQALASMQHPNVASLYDSGVTDQGTPFVVMELVDQALNVVDWCDANSASIEQRLQLFLQVCAGVAHAHEKGLLHRDLKPANLLITTVDDRPVVKVIDFGVSRAFSPGKGGLSQASVAGSPVYMSPEALGASSHTGLDTRSDIYSLGLVLCELICGELPFASDGSIGALVERLRSGQTVGPADWLSQQTHEHVASVARLRGATPVALRRAIAGDLDAIVLKAIAPDPANRYASPRDMARDIERHLHNEPIEARPPTRSYRTWRFVQRHRVGVAAASVALVTLIAFAGLMAVQANRVAQQRDRANLEAQAKGRVADFLTNMFSQANPYKAAGEDVTARELLDQATQSIDALTDQPAVQATLLTTMGDAYRALGLYPEAEPLLLRALDLHKELSGPNDVESLKAINALGALYRAQGRTDDAEPLALQALDGFAAALGEDDPTTIDARLTLGLVYLRQGRFEESEKTLLEGLDDYRRLLGDEDGETLRAFDLVGVNYAMQGRFDEAQPYLEQAYKGLRNTLGADHPRTLNAIGNFAAMILAQGKFDAAEPLLIEAYEATRRVHGPEHPETLNTLGNLSALYADSGRLEEAEAIVSEALAIRRRVQGEEHPETLLTYFDLALIDLKLGRVDQSIERLDAISAKQRELLGDQHPNTLMSILTLGDAHMTASRWREAGDAFGHAADGLGVALDPAHPNTIKARFRQAYCHAQDGRLAEAEAHFAESINHARGTYGDVHPYTAGMLFEVARARAVATQTLAASEALEQAIDAGFFAVDEIRQGGRFGGLDPDTLAGLVKKAQQNPAVDMPFSIDNPLPGY